MEVYGISAVVLITLLVELGKKVGWIKGDWAILAAVGLGVAFGVLNKVATIIPGFDQWYQIVFLGLMTGLSSMGLYDGSSTVIGGGASK
jgi:hypothetical protein